ncbi:hypothetical protein ACH3VR_21455 [Microbacterium sp. B2969]|uniref:Uncharacterized protein n=1 Tax=Microbacterium alkaliflavum TaxID=3248839 RepID=A0ABW7QER7_9MICO
MTDPRPADDYFSTPQMDALAERIGGVVVAWSRISWLLESLFAHLAGIEDDFVREVLVRKIRDGNLDQTCKDLAARLSTSDRDQVRHWLGSVGELRKERNRLLHSPMADFQTADDPEWRAGRLAVRLDRQAGTAVYGGEEMTAADLDTFRKRVATVHLAFFSLPSNARPF